MVDFPANPTLNQLYTFSGRTWRWNGSAWDAVGVVGSEVNPVTTGKAIAMAMIFGG